MGHNGYAVHTSIHATAELGGSKSTKRFRRDECVRFIKWCYDNGHNIKSIKDTTSELVAIYLKIPNSPAIKSNQIPSIELNDKEIATAHNKLVALRRGLKSVGVNLIERKISAKEIGLASKVRKGTKEPIPDDLFRNAVNMAYSNGENGFAISLKLERFLGLRGQESLMSIPALKQYAFDVRDLMTAIQEYPDDIKIEDGTKGGRKRTVRVVERFKEEALITISEALAYAEKNDGFLIVGKNDGLRSANNKYHRLAAEVGLTGKYSPHSLRYAYCVDKLMELKEKGYSSKDSLAITAELLGHGYARDRWIRMVYGQSLANQLPKTKTRHRRSLKEASQILKNLVIDLQNEGHTLSKTR